MVAAILSFTRDGVAYGEKQVPVKPLEIAFAAADKGVEKVTADSEGIASFFTDMDAAVGGLEASDPAAVIRELCAGEPKLMSLLLELCDL